MRKVFLWSVLILIVIYSGAWFITSKIVEREAHKYFSQLKEGKVIDEYSGNIYITGFPFSFNINLSHPRVKFQKKAAEYSTECDMLFDGILSVQLRFFSDKIKIQPIGDLHLRGKLNNYNFDYTIGGKNSLYQIHLSNSLILSAFKGAMAGKARKAQDIIVALVDKIIIYNADLRMFNKLTNKLLVYASEINFMVAVAGNNDNLYIKYLEKVSNAEFNEEFNVLSSKILALPFIKKIVNQIDINVRNYFDVFSFDKLGKINHDIDLKVNINKNSTLVEINNLRLQDDAYDIKLNGKVNSDDNKAVALLFKSKFSNLWYELMKVYANRLRVKEFESYSFGAGKNSIVSVIFNSISGFFKNMLQVRANYSTYVPELHKMGVIKGDIDVQYKGNKNAFKLNVDKLKVSADNFALDASGNAENTGKGQDKYQLKASFTNYAYIVDGLVGYINRIAQASGHVFVIFNKKLTISQSISDRIKFFLREVSDDPGSNSKDLGLTVVNKDGATCPAVGKYNSKDFCALWEGFIFNVLLLHITKELSPEEMLKTLRNPLSITSNIQKGAGEIAKDIVGGIFGGLLDQKKKE